MRETEELYPTDRTGLPKGQLGHLQAAHSVFAEAFFMTGISMICAWQTYLFKKAPKPVHPRP